MDLKPLGIVKEVIESLGMGVSYVYDDLVFLEHNAFLLQFTDTVNEMMIHRNIEADKQYIQETVDMLKSAGLSCGLLFMNGHSYSIKQAGDENIQLEFS